MNSEPAFPRDIAADIIGTPPNLGESLLPHVMTFSGMTAAMSRTYRPSDEALQHSWDNARFMRNDPAVMECVEARQRACALLNWHIEPENQKDPQQKEVADHLKMLLEQIPYFTQYRENLLHAIWYGRYAVQNVWRKKMVRRKMQTVVNHWLPVHGDKLTFSWDKEGDPFQEDRVGIRVGYNYKAGDMVQGMNLLRPNQVEPTPNGLAYFLNKAQRPLLSLHKHYIEDGEFETPDYAGRIHGVGIRSRIYWIWYQRNETLSWMMEYLERSGQGIDIYYFQSGNAESERRTRKAAEERIGTRNIILCPYFPDETARPVYDHIEPSMAGASAMKEVVTELHGHLIKRYILGQTLTSEQGSTGLGSNLADIHLGTFMQIIRYDATNLEERITNELVKHYIRYNFPEWSNYDFKFRIDTESDDAKERIESMETGYRMGLKIKTQEAYDTLGLSKPAEDDDVLQDPQHAQAEAQLAQQQAGAGGLPPGLTAKMASQFALALAQAPVTLEHLPAVAPQTMGYSPTSNTPSQDSERVKIRTYSGDDGDREDYRLKDSPGQSTMFGDDDWDEEEHPRESDGKFARKGSGSVRRKRENDGSGRRQSGAGPGLLEGLGELDNELSKDVSRRPAKAAPGKQPTNRIRGTGGSGSARGLFESDGQPSAAGGRSLFGERDEPAGSAGNGGSGNAPAGGGRPGTGNDRLGTSGGDGGSGGGIREAVAKPAKKPKPEVIHSVGNYRLQGDFAAGGMTGYKNNIAALSVLRDLRAEDREATPEEKDILAKYIGWGQYPQIFNKREYRSEWRDRAEQVRKLMGEAEFTREQNSLEEQERIAKARRSTLNAHYTNPDMVRAHWRINQRLGFKGGRFLEPAAGSGYYLGLMPEELARKTNTTAIELDTTTGDILKTLYPGSNVHIKGFQETHTPDNFYDLVASNVPFGDYSVHDRRYNKHKAPIHDYFFLKSVDAAKPGGIISHITSTGTLDKLDPSTRKELAKKVDFIGAIRMPGGAHAENAGTDVVTDLVILRKKRPGESPIDTVNTPTEAEPDRPGFTGVTTDSLGRVYHWVDGKRVPGDHWTETTEVPDPAGGEPIRVNRYFAENPQMVMGTIDRSGKLYGGNQKGVTAAENWREKLDAAIDSLPENILDTSSSAPSDAVEMLPSEDSTKDGGYIWRDGELFQRRGPHLEAVTAPPGVENFQARVRGQMQLRDAMQALIKAQIDETDTQGPREVLNDLYDDFVDKYGYLHDADNRKAFDGDPDQLVIASLEDWDPKTKTAQKSEIFRRDTVNQGLDRSHAESVEQGLTFSLHQSAKVDPEYIARITGLDLEEVHDQLSAKGIAFENPNGGWETAAQYLSGNVRQKLEIAKQAASADPRYQPNVTALENAQPEKVEFNEIEFRLGTPWIPASDVADFAAELIGGEQFKGKGTENFDVSYYPTTSQWDFSFGSSRLAGRSTATSVWATPEFKFYKIFNAALNNKQLKVYHEVDGKRAGVNQLATEAANDKVQALKEEFQNWLWSDDERRKRLEGVYNEVLNNTVPMKYDGSHQTFPGRVGFELRPMQKNFVWQAVTTGTGLAGHEVGTGKTASMIAAAMEMRRLKLAKKPAILCLKSNIEQMTAEAREQYPNAKILSLAEAKNAKQRNKMISQIATGDYDIVFMTHTNFGMIPVSGEVQSRFIREEIAELEAAKYRVQEQEGKASAKIVKALEKAKANLEAKLQDALASDKKDDALRFEQLGIDQIFVDEAHKFKSLPVYTSQQNVKGIPTTRSDRATDMKMKAQWLQEQNGGRGVVFATGTPVANTMAEMYNMQRYLQPQELKDRGVENFDAWAATYGDMETRQEVTLAGDYKPITRMSKFMNIPELMQVSNQVFDVQRVENQRNPDGSMIVKRPKRRDTMVVSDDNDEVQKMMSDIASRADAVKGKRRAMKGEDNMLTITTDARKGAIDLRLLYANAPDLPTSKANKCVAKVLELVKANPGQTQLIFSDTGVNKVKGSNFSLYADLKKKLIAGGLKPNQIADFSRLTGAKKLEAQEKMRSGEILVALGSTQKLGTGVNVQTKLQAIHHLDVPYVPASIEQRDGRGWRSGNKNSTGEINIYRYVQEGSADQLSWQIVMRKAGFINAIMNRKNVGRTMYEEDTEALTPEQMIAAASGDQRLVERLEVEQELKRLTRARSRHETDQARLKNTHANNIKRAEALAKEAKEVRADAKHIDSFKGFQLTLEGRAHTERKTAEEHLNEVVAKADAQIHRAGTYSWNRSPLEIGEYRGAKLWRDVDGGFILQAPSGRQYMTTDSLRGIEATARSITKKADQLDETAAGARTDNERIAGMFGKPFAQADQLAELQKRLKALDDDLKKNKEKKRIEVDEAPGVEAEAYALIGERFTQAFYAPAVEHYLLDASGHQHRGKGQGGGQFVPKEYQDMPGGKRFDHDHPQGARHAFGGSFGSSPILLNEDADPYGTADHGKDVAITRKELARANRVSRPLVQHGEQPAPKRNLFDLFAAAINAAIGFDPHLDGTKDTYYAGEDDAEQYAKDASGHEHKGKGPGGGQFTGPGQGGPAGYPQQHQQHQAQARNPVTSGQHLAQQRQLPARPQVIPQGAVSRLHKRQIQMAATHYTPPVDGMSVRPALAQRTSRLSHNSVSALHAYTYHEHAFPLNDGLRKDPTGASLAPPQKALYEQLKSALKEANGLDKPVAAYRGVDSRFSEKALADAQKALSGSRVIEGHGISSLSINPAKSVEYAKGSTGVLYRIKAKSGAYVEPITRAKGEEEIVHGHGKRYFVHGITEEDHVSTDGSKHKMRVIHLEELV